MYTEDRSNPGSCGHWVGLNVDKAVGAALNELRKRKGLTQEALTLEAGAERAYVSLIERGKNSPSARMAFKLCRILDASPSTLFAEAERLLSTSEHPDRQTPSSDLPCN